MLIDEVDFEDFARWMWDRHENVKLSISHLNDCTDTYLGITYGKVPKDFTNQEMVNVMIELNLIKKLPCNSDRKYQITPLDSI